MSSENFNASSVFSDDQIKNFHDHHHESVKQEKHDLKAISDYLKSKAIEVKKMVTH